MRIFTFIKGFSATVVLTGFILFLPGQSAGAMEMNSALMESTFIISDGNSSGTVFLLGRPSSKGTGAHYVLVTAAHVLEDMPGETALISMRQKDKKGRWRKRPVEVAIRKRGRPLWARHPDVDTAAMYIPLPKDITLPDVLSSNAFLAPDEDLKTLEIHPGDEVLCLGFPVGTEANEAGFPILRSGKIASYPILPTKETKQILIDANIFHGNSGSPVYFNYTNRQLSSGLQIGSVNRQILGLVSEIRSVTETRQGLSGPQSESTSLGLAVVIPSSFIRETIDMLPAL